ncbi:MAG: hypothetical protein ACRD2G_05850, partial [Terriglobia bacterium]
MRSQKTYMQAVAVAFLAVIIGLTWTSAFAQTTVTASWTDSNGNWTSAANWSCTPTISVCVPNNGGGNLFNVTISGRGSVSLDSTSNPTSVTIDRMTNASS